MLSSSGAITNELLDRQETPYRYGAQTKVLPLSVEPRILKNKIVEQNDLDEPLQYSLELYSWKLPYPRLQGQRLSLLLDMHLIKPQISSQGGELPTRLPMVSCYLLPICIYMAVKPIYQINKLKGEINQLLTH